MSKSLQFVILLCVCVFCQTAFFVYVVATYDKRISRYKVEESNFRSAVNYACTNYLESRLLPLMSSRSDLVVTTNDIRVVPIASLSTWHTFSGSGRCRVDGVDYAEGDYCDYGLVLKVSIGRVYCRGYDGRSVILRRLIKDDSPPFARVLPQDAPHDGGGRL